jgi:primosomal protein N' (replication factor Y)
MGIQKLEEETAREFPHARLLRWDSDSARTRRDHERIMDQLKSHQADILIGTQMIAKGLDLAHVTLVGVVSADISLNIPDFRAGERTFQLLTQVAGRAGRGAKAGQVIIQTYFPEHYAIQAVLHQNYRDFYDQEITYRRQFNAPPISQMLRISYSHTNEDAAKTEAAKVKSQMTAYISYAGITDVQIIGPAPAFITRLRGHYRYQIILKGRNPVQLLNSIELPRGWIVDVDPIGIH